MYVHTHAPATEINLLIDVCNESPPTTKQRLESKLPLLGMVRSKNQGLWPWVNMNIPDPNMAIRWFPFIVISQIRRPFGATTTLQGHIAKSISLVTNV